MCFLSNEKKTDMNIKHFSIIVKCIGFCEVCEDKIFLSAEVTETTIKYIDAMHYWKKVHENILGASVDPVPFSRKML